MINLEHLTEEERKIILDVLRRDDEQRKTDEVRLKKLKTELYELRKKSAIKVDDEEAAAASSKKVCARCREPLGALINSGEVCPKCQQKVCTNCKVVLPMTKKWLCTICNKQLQIRLESGHAFGPWKEGKEELYGTDLVRASLQRSKLGQDPDVIITSAPLQISPSDSGYNGRIANASSMGESGDLSGGYEDDEDYTSDNSYQQSTLSGVESIGPSVSQRGSLSHHHGLDDHSATRYDSSTPSSPWLSPHVPRRRAPRGVDDMSTPPASETEDGRGRHYRKKRAPRGGDREGSDRGSTPSSQANSAASSPSSSRARGPNHPSPDRSLVASTQGSGQRQGKRDDVTLQRIPSQSLYSDEAESITEEKSRRNAHGKASGKPAAIPTIAIYDAGDAQSDGGNSHTGSWRLNRQAEEGRLFMDEDSAAKGAVDANGGVLSTKASVDAPPKSEAPATPKTAPSAPMVKVETAPSEVSAGASSGVAAPDDFTEPPKFKARSTGSTVSSPVGKKTSKKEMLHKGSTSSLASLYSTGEEFYGKYPITGDINFGLNYNFKTNVFEIKIHGCRDLVPIDAKRNKSDPYVKTYLLPDKSKNSKRKTKMRKGTINPHYDENLRYNISQSELETRTLSIAVWHYDRFGHNMFLGEVPLSLDAVQFSNYPMKWHQLQARAPASDAKPISYKGDIIIALMFETPPTDENKNANETGTPSKRKSKKGQKSNPVGGTLKVHVKEARNLTAARPNGSANPYVKLYLEPDRSKGGKKKTSVMKNTINPVYEQGFDFPNITEEILKERALEVGIWDHEPVGTSPFMGGIRLGNGTGKSYDREVGWQDSTGVEIQLWDEMLANHNQWVEACLTLRSSLQKDKKT
ncbi:synaptotagmin-like protein 5 isoform X4 [Diadema antillarum]|uniref:synaptotagmin-like protein 5 isoform X4 n=1 Tax=Diadema antillarum TaxID=105358 RepID=UPI003A84D476